MEVYLVGGAVRDALLGRPVTERDWVVVGATPDDMERRGFRPVGRDFPVFLHPQTHEEYALARTERKTGRGYHGFRFHAAPDVPLEQDLARRDLTVNAMAQRPDGTLVDPFDGRSDLEARRLRHVSAAFQEDPVRILRLARFTARYAPLGFTPADDTMALCRSMTAAGEVDHLVPERVWQELEKALDEPRPSAFFRVLRDCGALARLFPELDGQFGCRRHNAAGAEVDAAEHALAALDTAADAEAERAVRLALALQFTPQDGDRPEDDATVHALAERLRLPNEYRGLVRLTVRDLTTVHAADRLDAAGVLALLERADGFRQPDRFRALLQAAELDARASGCTVPETGYAPGRYLDACLQTAAAITGGDFAREGLRGAAIGERVHRERLEAIAGVAYDPAERPVARDD
ncbi:multifunctional CCA addition/repair protein [Aquisalimonas lutea]|uniref:multifunctional CCA addition/repair protein n=1 Tax=Aquisalimonas lutea TaxID=1327750 RepID=UPI0025B6084A|nr:multifunctional CCA addition/repair protein [Aquisalimonas lutea]MDN3516889.1 multifunctional CCA addition/repair protein [Aquisalimonas lutea]